MRTILFSGILSLIFVFTNNSYAMDTSALVGSSAASHVSAPAPVLNVFAGCHATAYSISGSTFVAGFLGYHNGQLRLCSDSVGYFYAQSCDGSMNTADLTSVFGQSLGSATLSDLKVRFLLDRRLYKIDRATFEFTGEEILSTGGATFSSNTSLAQNPILFNQQLSVTNTSTASIVTHSSGASQVNVHLSCDIGLY